MQDNENRGPLREEWHKAKVFSIAHLMATLLVIAGGVGFVYVFGQEFGVMKNDVARNKVEIKSIQDGQLARDNRLNEKLSGMRVEQKRDLQRIEDKLDRLIERDMP